MIFTPINFIYPNLELYMKTEKLTLLLAFFVGITLRSYSQPFPPQPRAIPPPVGAPVPIDDEIWILLLAGLFLGIFLVLRKIKT